MIPEWGKYRSVQRDNTKGPETILARRKETSMETVKRIYNTDDTLNITDSNNWY